jgi:sugar phosphate isomerase/epimerase
MRFAICNEMFAPWPFDQVCRFAAEVGFQGVEAAPFTLAPLVTDIDAATRTELYEAAQQAGVQVVGLHWLLAQTEGLHLTCSDAQVRARTADYLAELVRFCADLDGGVIVFGSPQQRNRDAATDMDTAMARAIETLGPALDAAAQHDVRICMEPLGLKETNFLTTAAEGLELVQRAGHPNLALHLDVKAMSTQGRPIPEIIREYGPAMGHFHANDANLRGPGEGQTDFVPILEALLDIGYDGWVSVEPFEWPDGPEACARNSIAALESALEQAAG